MLSCAVIIPVGPGHEQLALEAEASVWRAWRHPGPFGSLVVQPVPDHAGTLGRSRARNMGMDMHPDVDFYFLLDADDQMMEAAFTRVDVNAPATFGAIVLTGRPLKGDRHPCTRKHILRYGPSGTLAMGCFVNARLGLRFNVDLDVGEDFDFYMRLPGFTKQEEPLVDIGYHQPSAGGPRGYERVDWLAACQAVVDAYGSSFDTNRGIIG